MNDDELRRMLRDEPVPGTIDVSRVVARARRRRLPRRVGAGAVGALAVVGVTVLGVQAIAPSGGGPTAVMMQEEAARDGAPDTAAPGLIDVAPAEKVNGCTGPVVEVGASASGLRLSVAFPDVVPAGSAAVAGEVVLENAGPAAVTGTASAPPAITIARDGIVLWHSNGLAVEWVSVSLQPGESVRLPATFEPVVCGVGDDALERFRPDLPAIEPGPVQVSALLDFAADGAVSELVGGETATIEVR